MTKFFLTAAFVLPLLAASAAHAGTVISDQRSWPNEIHSSNVRAGGSVLDAQASMDIFAPAAILPTYRGGPKTGTRF